MSVCTPVRERLLMWGSVMIVAVALLAACGSSKSKYAPVQTTAKAVGASTEDVAMKAGDFPNIHKWTKVSDFYVGNVLGHLDEALAVARNPKGGVYPVGTVIQLVPTEAMVKRRAGWDKSTRDWEFFSLAVSKDGARILSRGASKTENFLHLNCAACHNAAKAQFDETCGHDHGCAPLPLTPQLIKAIQESDPRPLN